MAAAFSLKDYLKRYESGAEDPRRKKKKKKEKPKSSSMATGVLVVDEDPVWQKPVRIEDEEGSDSAGEEENPQIDEDIEVKRMKRLEAIRSRKPYHGISEDGSGWVTISDPSKAADHSPPRQRRPRFDTPSPEPKLETSGAEEADLSPPRQRRRRAYTHSPERELKPLKAEDADISPPRRRRRADTPSLEHEVKPSEAEDGDISPPRRRRRRADTPSPPVELGRKVTAGDRRRSTEDLSPRRWAWGGSPTDDDLSPPRRARKGSPGDLSPPPQVRRSSQDPADLSLPRRSQRKSAAGDLSPPRQAHRRSPGARGPGGSAGADLPSPRRSFKDASEERDLSPPRKSKRGPPLAKEARRGGLFSGEEIKEEINKKRAQEKSSFATMDPSISGKAAEPVFRDKGKRISKEELLKRQEEEKPKEKKLEWGKGLAQKREAEARAQELELEKDRPFARSRDDAEIDKMLKQRIRWGDPMAHLVKKNSELLLEDFGVNEKMQESGFIIPQDIPSHSWIKRAIDFPPNRYGIRPGRHWDGVDRSNGSEKELFKRQNEKRATEREAYLWSVSEM